MIRKKRILFYFMLVFSHSIAAAQESVNTSGGDIVGSGGTFAFSLGQILYTTNESGAGNVAQGVQHAYEIFSTGFSESLSAPIVYLYPNPVSEILTLQISEQNTETKFYKLFDANGKLLNKGDVLGLQTSIDMGPLPNAAYLLTITNIEGKKIQGFKIIKN